MTTCAEGSCQQRPDKHPRLGPWLSCRSLSVRTSLPITTQRQEPGLGCLRLAAPADTGLDLASNLQSPSSTLLLPVSPEEGVVGVWAHLFPAFTGSNSHRKKFCTLNDGTWDLMDDDPEFVS